MRPGNCFVMRDDARKSGKEVMPVRSRQSLGPDTRQTSRTRLGQTMRRRAAAAGAYACAVCGWRVPQALDRNGKGRGLAVHHVIPVMAGGSDDESNLVILCPNHHAMAHCFPVVCGRYDGPQSPGRLVDELRSIERDGDAWVREQDRKGQEIAYLIACRIASGLYDA
jgi:hypothetical protein